MTKLLPAFLVAFLLSVAPALAQTCPATPTACPSPTYNNLTVGGLLNATGNLTVGGIFSAPSLTLTGAGTALNVTNNATIGGTLGVGSTLTLGTGGASNQRIQASGTGNMVVQLGGSASIMNFVAGTGNSLLQINSATNQVTSERMLVLNALGVSNPVASGSAQTAPLYSTLAWTGSSTLNNTVLSTGFYISNSTAIAAANNVPQNVGYIANVTATGVKGNVGTFGVNLIQNAVNAMSGSPTYTAMASYVFMQANDGGTGTGTNARGQATALNLVTGFNAPGGFLNGGSGTEIDMFATTGTYIQGKVGILIALASQNTVQGDLEDAAMVFDRTLTSPGWKTIFQIGDAAWAGIDPTNGWVMQFFGHNFTGSVPGAGGIDFTNFTPSVAFIQGPGFLLDPSGNFTAASLTTSGTLSAASLTLTGAMTVSGVATFKNNVLIGNIISSPTTSPELTIQGFGGSNINLSGSQTYRELSIFANIYGSTTSDLHFVGITNLHGVNTGGSPNGAFDLFVSNSVTAGGTHTAIAGSTNVNGAGVSNGGFYVAVDGWTFASKNVGGTSGALANSKGHAFATNPQVLLTSGATFWYEATGEEIDVSVASGASAYLVNGLQVVLLSNHAVHGLSGIDSAINIGAQIGATTGFDFGLRMSNPGGPWPYVSTATLIGIPAPGATNTIAAANGIDFSLVPFSGFFLKSQGFTVDGIGNVTSAGTITAGSAGVGGFYTFSTLSADSIIMGTNTSAGVDVQLKTGNGSNIVLNPQGAGIVKVNSAITMSGAVTLSAAGTALNVTSSATVGGTLNVTGSANLNSTTTIGTNTATSFTIINGPIGSNRNVRWASAGVARFQLTANSTAEAGGGTNSGSDLDITIFDDSGAVLLNPAFRIYRATGIGQFFRGVIISNVPTASLPACSGSNKGLLNGVSDATSPTYNGTLTGGGSVSVPVYCNGVSWTTH